MLPDINLDTENFDDLVEEAKNIIISLYPGWTDYNYHDPGITLIELFAWLKEIQQFYINQIGEQHKISYLRLFGMKRMRKKSASARVNVTTEEDIIMPNGTKLYAGNICFETLTREMLVGKNMNKCIAKQKDDYSIIETEKLMYNGKERIYIFGKSPKVGNKFYISFLKPITENIPLSIYFNIYDDYIISRPPINNHEFYPLAKLKYTYYSEREWKELNIIKDETYDLIYDGSIHFIIDKKMDLTNVCGEEGYFICIELIECNYDLPPILVSISINMVSVIQKETKTECYDFSIEELTKNIEYKADLSSCIALKGMSIIYLGVGEYFYELTEFSRKLDTDKKIIQYSFNIPEGDYNTVRIVCYTEQLYFNQILGIGDGFPEQQYDLEDNTVVYDSFRIMVSDIEIMGSFCEWERVSDFQSSSPADKHYVLEEDKGKVLFGDCKCGMAPEGEIRIIGYAVCEGSGGNVKLGAIKKFNEDIYSSIKTFNEDNAYGGTDTESIEECFLRFRKGLKEVSRGITSDDYESLVYQTPGLMISSCKVIDELYSEEQDGVSNLISIVVKPFSLEEEPKVNKSYEKNIHSFLNEKRLLGTKIKVLSPKYIYLKLFLEVKLRADYLDGKSIVKESVREYFRSLVDRFGAPVLYNNIYGMIDTLPCVEGVNSLTIDADGEGIIRSINGDIGLPPNGLVILKDIQCIFTVN